MQIYIPENCSKINVLVSGGVDSSILLFLLLKQTQGKTPITVFSFEAPNNLLWSPMLKTVKTVLDWNEKYFCTKIEHKLYKRKHKVYIRRVVEDIWLTEGGCVYSGCNKVLYDEISPTKYIPGDTPPVRGEPFSDIHIRPFINIDKIDIMRLYQEHNVLELLSLTKSCGISTTPCRECYFCMERQWAATHLGIADI
jgi:hypothetical protein